MKVVNKIYLLLQLGNFEEHEIEFILSWTKDCSLWLTYELCTENYNTGTAICFSRVVKKTKM